MYRVCCYHAAMAVWTIDKPDRLTVDEAVTHLTVFLVAGRLNVVGTDGPARIEVTAVGRKPITVRHERGALSVRHEDVRRWPGLVRWFTQWFAQFGRRYRADISVAVPRDRPVELTMVSGSVVASALLGGARVDVTSGRITLLGLDGQVSAKVVAGPIEALGIGGDLHLETVSGEITLADSMARRVFARAVSGAITCDLDNPSDSEIRLETTSGEITARVREDSDLDVHLHAMAGRVTTAFPQLSGRTGHGSVTGVLGAGSGKLRITAASGRIALLSRPVEDDAAGDDPAGPNPAGGPA